MFRKIIFGLIISFVFTSIAFGQKEAAKVSVKNNSQTAAHQTLDEKIKAELANFRGNVWIYAKNLDTGRDYALRADEQVRTASTIKPEKTICKSAA